VGCILERKETERGEGKKKKGKGGEGEQGKKKTTLFPIGESLPISSLLPRDRGGRGKREKKKKRKPPNGATPTSSLIRGELFGIPLTTLFKKRK